MVRAAASQTLAQLEEGADCSPRRAPGRQAGCFAGGSAGKCSAISHTEVNLMGSSPLQGRTIAFLFAQEGVEEVELTGPREAVERAGAVTHLIAPKAGEVQAFDHLDRSSTYAVDRTLDEAEAADYD